MYPVISTATAPAIQPDIPVIVPPPEPEWPRRQENYQTVLFPVREVPKAAALASGMKSADRGPERQAGLPGRVLRRRNDSTAQSLLDLQPPEPQTTRRLRSSAEAAIYCDWQAASLAHRTLATVLDLSMIAIGMGVFLMVFYFGGGELTFNRITIPLYFAAPVAIALLYELLWSLAGGETPGMKWTELRLLDFDGHAPNPKQRVFRVAGTFLSLLAGGMGILWAIFDEENLTWHDHISKTFPAPDQDDDRQRFHGSQGPGRKAA
jgi:uncharacterized RDD family membrane protein YckC